MIIVLMVAVMIIVVPVAVGMPALIAHAPPTVVPLPAAFSFGIQVATALFRFVAGGSVLAHSRINPRFSPFNPTLAISVIVGERSGHAQQHRTAKHSQDYRRYSRPLEILEFQSSSSLFNGFQYRSTVGLGQVGGRCLQFV